MSSSRLSTSELLDGLAPVEMRFLNQVAWRRGLPLLELLGESGLLPELLEAIPCKNR